MGISLCRPWKGDILSRTENSKKMSSFFGSKPKSNKKRDNNSPSEPTASKSMPPDIN